MDRRAFTLIELLVSIAVIAVLLGLFVPILGQVRDAAKQTKCLSNTRQLLVAVNAFSAQNGGRFPENRTMTSETEYETWRGRFVAAGLVADEELWICPLHPNPQSELGYQEGRTRCVGDVTSSYALNGHVLWKYLEFGKSARVSDGAIRRPSHTILLAETNRRHPDLRASPPIVANYYGYGEGAFGYWHAGDGVYGFQDGHVETLGFLETGSPDCRWHNGADLTDDQFVPQTPEEIRPHAHPDWVYLVPDVYK